jgi:hypothetical protein
MLGLTLGNVQGLYVKLSDQRDIVARMSLANVNMPDFDGCPFQEQVSTVKFEAAVYKLLRSEPDILVAYPLYHRIPVQHPSPRLNIPQDIAGRSLFLFERTAGGENENLWNEIGSEGKVRADVSVCSARFNMILTIFHLDQSSVSGS